jgi:hypothetical protein
MSPAIVLLAQNDPSGAAGVLGGFAAFIFVVWILALLATAFWLCMLVDAVVSEPTTEQKILWFLVVFFLHFIGALIYFFVRKAGRSRTTAVG